MPLNITSSPAVRDCVKRHEHEHTQLSASKTLASLGTSAGTGSHGEAWPPPEVPERKGERTETMMTRASNLDEQIALLREKSKKTDRQQREDLLNLVIGGVIMVNAIVIALETDLKPPDDEASTEDKVVWILLESIFCIIFAVEIIIRVKWTGLKWFCQLANMFDAALVFVMMVETWILSFVAKDLDGVAVVAVLRLFRLVRLVRLLRIVKLCRGFYAMACAFFHAAKSMVWLCLMMFVGLFLFSLFTTAFIGKSDDFKDVDMGGWTGRERFGTVFRSMYSLFELMTLEGWPNVGRPLITIQPGMFLFLFIFIMVFTFGLLNMIVAMVVEATITQAKTMEELTDQERNERFADQLEAMRKVFELSDTDGNGTLTLSEFEATISDNEVATAIFECLRVSPEDAKELYCVLDADERNEISIDDFVDGCAKVRGGQPTHFDIIATRAGVHSIRRQMTELRNLLKGLVLDAPSPRGEVKSNGISVSEGPGATDVMSDAAVGTLRTTAGVAGVGAADMMQRLDAQALVQKQILARLEQLAAGQAELRSRIDAVSHGAGVCRSNEPSAVTTHDGGSPRLSCEASPVNIDMPGTIERS